MKDIIRTNLHPRDYTIDEVYRIVNPKQYKLFIKHRVLPIDIYPSIDKDGNDVTVHVFLREDCKEVFEAWNNHTLV